MRRLIYEQLLGWKNNPNRKPLILNGARQTGKTWLLKEFGSKEYKKLAYINCDESPEIKNAFTDYKTDRLIRFFSVLSNTVIEPENTLIVLDEVQTAPNALTALKYFCEDAGEYHIAVAGSLLGIGLHEGTGFPVGKVDEINLYPLSYTEFLLAMGQEQLVNFMSEQRFEETAQLEATFIDYLRQYYYVGGMPAVVRDYVEKQDFKAGRDIQNQILSDYRRDFSKHIPSDLLPKINLVWDSLPAQLAKENKKFIYGMIKKGSRAKEFEKAIQWLMDAGLVYKVKRVTKVEKPLKFYEDHSSFKLFMLDMGLLGAMSDVSAKDVLVNNTAFTEYKGAFTEQFVLQELVGLNKQLYYYSKENSTLELDFLLQKEELYPIEVKAEENLKSKSLRTVYENDNRLHPVRFSMAGYKEQDWLINVPLYLVQSWANTLP